MKEKILNYQITVRNFTISPKVIMKHPLFFGSAIMIFGSNFTNFIAYLYHLIIGRLLGPKSYGELAAIISLMGLFSTSFIFLALVIVKFVSAAKDTELGKLYSWFNKISLRVAFGASILLLLLLSPLSKFLHIEAKILVLLIPILFITAIGITYRAFLQGLLKFGQVVGSSVVDVLGRLLLGTLFIYLGFSVFGTVFAIVLSSLMSVLLLKYFLNKLNLKISNKKFKDGKRIIKYSAAIMAGSIATNSIFSTDLLLVKHFFSSYEAGIYASVSTLGRVIFYGTAPVAAVMFPLISKRHSKGETFKKIFFTCFLMIFGICIGVVLIFFLFPELSIKILFGGKYLDASPHLVRFGVFMSIFALASLILNFYLSLEKSKVVIVSVITALIQIIGIWFFHSSIASVINVSILAVSFMFLSLLVYFVYDIKKGKIK